MFSTENPDLHITNMGWTSIVDLKHRLMIHVSLNVTKVEVNRALTDPDGVPIVWLEGKHVTRVRKLTEDEFNIKKYGMSTADMTIRRVHYVKEKDVPKKKGDK